MISQTGILFDSQTSLNSGEIILGITRTAKLAILAARAFGQLLIVISVVGIILLFLPIVLLEVNYRVVQKNSPAPKPISRFGMLLAQHAAQDEQMQVLAQRLGFSDTYFSISIPKIGAKTKIVENVDTVDKNTYLEALSRGIAHAAGSNLPGGTGGTFLFAHSTDSPLNFARYNAVFYLLHELEPEKDEIYIFRLNKLYKYKVTEKHVVPADDVSWFTDSKKGEERLILQTCWPPGTTWKRLIIVAKPEKI